MSPTANVMRPGPRSRGARSLRKLDESRRDIDRDDVGAALGQLDRERACAAAGVEQRGAACRSAAARRAASRASRRGPARTVARMRPTGASEVRRFQASTAVRSK